MSEWKVYAVQVFDKDNKAITRICTIEAPSVGAAVELHLASHGVLGYERATVRLVTDDIEPNEDRFDILRWYPDIEDEAAELDTHHHPELLDEQVIIDKAEYEGLQKEIADAHAMFDRFGVTGTAHTLASRVETMAILAFAGELEANADFVSLFKNYGFKTNSLILEVK